MFNREHIWYMIVSCIVTIVLLVLAKLAVKDQNKKNLILKFSAVITVVIHYSNIWVNFFATGGNAVIESNHILPAWPCNVVMWMLVIAAFIKDNNSAFFRLFGDFCFLVGVACAVVGIAFNTNFGSNPTLYDYDVLKGLLSHSTMLFGCLYLMVGGYVRIGVFNALSVAFGFGLFVICGSVVNALYAAFGMTSPDGMLLISNPYFDMPIVLAGLIVLAVLFLVLVIYEQRLPKEERWYSRLKKKIKEK